MKPEDFDLFASLLRQRSGLVLTREKAYLLESRLLPIVRKWNLQSLEDMALAIRIRRDEAMLTDITEAMTTNETSFFRDFKLFGHFQKLLLPRLMATRADRKQLRIWSAGCSSGQEAYSLAMICAEEAAKLQGWKIDIVGTDISREMLTRAREGIYSQFEVQHGLPVTLLVKYFTKPQSDKWEIKENIRQMVQFRDGNLVRELGPVGTFDIVFCRNVLVYLEPDMQEEVRQSIASIMAPDGVLILGRNEKIPDISGRFKPVVGEAAIYAVMASPSAA